MKIEKCYVGQFVQITGIASEHKIDDALLKQAKEQGLVIARIGTITGIEMNALMEPILSVKILVTSHSDSEKSVYENILCHPDYVNPLKPNTIVFASKCVDGQIFAPHFMLKNLFSK